MCPTQEVAGRRTILDAVTTTGNSSMVFILGMIILVI